MLNEKMGQPFPSSISRHSSHYSPFIPLSLLKLSTIRYTGSPVTINSEIYVPFLFHSRITIQSPLLSAPHSFPIFIPLSKSVSGLKKMSTVQYSKSFQWKCPFLKVTNEWPSSLRALKKYFEDMSCNRGLLNVYKNYLWAVCIISWCRLASCINLYGCGIDWE